MKEGVFRGWYAFSWGAHTAGTTRRVFNNIFAQVDGMPGQNTTGMSADDDFEADGNLYWSVREGKKQSWDFFVPFRLSPVFADSKKHYAPGLGLGDRFGDPQFVSLDVEGKQPLDARIKSGSAAARGGVAIPAEWPDPLRAAAGTDAPDIGAVPVKGETWRVGVHGRISLAGVMDKAR
jgi:hypothetical protein